MNKTESALLTVIILLFLAFVFISVQFGFAAEKANLLQKQAVECGAATWDTDSSGKSTFRWLNEKKSEK